PPISAATPAPPISAPPLQRRSAESHSARAADAGAQLKSRAGAETPEAVDDWAEAQAAIEKLQRDFIFRLKRSDMARSSTAGWSALQPGLRRSAAAGRSRWSRWFGQRS